MLNNLEAVTSGDGTHAGAIRGQDPTNPILLQKQQGPNYP